MFNAWVVCVATKSRNDKLGDVKDVYGQKSNRIDINRVPKLFLLCNDLRP